MPGDCSYHFIGEQELSNCALSVYIHSSPNYTSSSAAIYTGGNSTTENTTHLGIRDCSKSPFLSAYQNTLRLNSQEDSVYTISGKTVTMFFLCMENGLWAFLQLCKGKSQQRYDVLGCEQSYRTGIDLNAWGPGFRTSRVKLAYAYKDVCS